MPLILNSPYRPPYLLRNPHANTIFGAYFPVSYRPPFARERIRTPDDDFLDLDWVRNGARSLLVICHGIVGSSGSPYVRSLSQHAVRAGFDVLAWNCRGCSGEPNRTTRLYHSGATDDLETVLRHIGKTSPYSFIALVGFSLGANLALKYLGEPHSQEERAAISAAVAVSSPCDLEAAALQMERPENILYSRHIVSHIHQRIRSKHKKFPQLIDPSGLAHSKTIRECDERYIAPLHGFDSAHDYYQKCSATQFLGGITVPTLILNSKDDPFLRSTCHPHKEAQQFSNIWLELTDYGGHVSYGQFSVAEPRWHDQRILQFLLKARATKEPLKKSPSALLT